MSGSRRRRRYRCVTRTERPRCAVGPNNRPYFLLRDTTDSSVTRVAERLVPLKLGPNFRDIGGYAGTGGRHVRWGLIYRAGATPMLSAQDQTPVNGFHLKLLFAALPRK